MKMQHRVVLTLIIAIIVSLSIVEQIAAFPDLEQEISIALPGIDGVRLIMRLIPAGSFIMGSPNEEKDRGWDEGPQHKVTISRPFYMGIFEVTKTQWATLMSTEPSVNSDNFEYPVVSATWNDCQKFIDKINTLGLGTFRFPTEAEWEYACRAGTTTRFPWGDDLDYLSIGEHAWYKANSSGTVHPVGQKKPNAWGLYDMNGNVWEWCSDRYLKTYKEDIQIDPTGPSTGNTRVLRGGAYSGTPQVCRSARRDFAGTSAFSAIWGFRLVRIL